MVGPFGETDLVFEWKQQFLQLATMLFVVMATSVTLAPFEKKMYEILFGKGSDFPASYFFAKTFWSIAMLFVAFAWWLESRTTGLGFTYRVAFHATLVGSILFNIVWPRFYFMDDGKPYRFSIAMILCGLGILSAVAALIFISVNIWLSYLVLTAKASAIVAAIFIFINIALMAGSFLFFYTMELVITEETQGKRE